MKNTSPSTVIRRIIQKTVLGIIGIATAVGPALAARPNNRQPPTVNILTPADTSDVSGSVQITTEACAVPTGDFIVAMQVRFHPPSGPATAWRDMTFIEGSGCISGTYNWDSSEFGNGVVGIDSRAADSDGSTTKWSSAIDITVNAVSGGGNTLLGNRHLFVWDNTIVGDSPRTSELLAFAVSKSIEVIFIDVQPLGDPDPGNPAESVYTDFLADCHAAGLQVYALSGDPFWGVSCGENLPGQVACMQDGWDFYQNVIDVGLPFDGFIDNTEPYNADSDDWWSRLDDRAQQYLDFYHGLRDRIGNSVHLTSTIPFWYDQDPETSCMKLDGKNGPCKPLNWYVATIADDCAIMDYRDVADGPNGLVTHAIDEIATHKTIIGIETQELGMQDDSLTFFEEGEAVMEAELTKVYNAFVGDSNFLGFFIHYYGSYKTMSP